MAVMYYNTLKEKNLMRLQWNSQKDRDREKWEMQWRIFIEAWKLIIREGMIVQLIIVEEIENHHLKHFQKNTFIKVSRMLNTLPHLYLNCQSFLGQKKKKIYIYTDRKWIKYRLQVTEWFLTSFRYNLYTQFICSHFNCTI